LAKKPQYDSHSWRAKSAYAEQNGEANSLLLTTSRDNVWESQTIKILPSFYSKMTHFSA